MAIKITKQLATMEDLAIGIGTVVQERNGVPLTLNKISFSSTTPNIASMQTTQATVGTTIQTLGYYSAGDGGSNTYEIVAGGTGTADGGSFIQLNNGLQAKGLFNEGVFADQFGLRGDGVTNDGPKATNAAAFGATVTFNSSKSYLLQNFQLPGKDSIIDFNNAEIIVNGADCVIFYALTDIAQFNIVHKIINGRFLIETNHTAIKAHNVWQPGVRLPPIISNNEFYVAWSVTAVDSIISLQGLNSVNIKDNSFLGGPERLTNNIYGVVVVLGDDFNTSVMNCVIEQNTFTRIGFPIYFHDRTLLTGGRVEGTSIQNNTFVLCRECVRLNIGLSDRIQNNLFSQIFVGIDITTSNSVISGNQFESTYNYGLIVRGTSQSFFERNTVVGNNFKHNTAETTVANPCCILITAATAEKVRFSDFSNNVFYSVNNNTIDAVIFEIGSNNIVGLNFSGCQFLNFDNAFSSDTSTEGLIRRFTGSTFLFGTNRLFDDPDVFSNETNPTYGSWDHGVFGGVLDARGVDVISCLGTSDITGLHFPEVKGKRVLIINKSSGGRTLVHSSTFVLVGAVDRTLGPDRSIEMVKHFTQWLEVGS